MKAERNLSNVPNETGEGWRLKEMEEEAVTHFWKPYLMPFEEQRIRQYLSIYLYRLYISILSFSDGCFSCLDFSLIKGPRLELLFNWGSIFGSLCPITTLLVRPLTECFQSGPHIYYSPLRNVEHSSIPVRLSSDHSCLHISYNQYIYIYIIFSISSYQLVCLGVAHSASLSPISTCECVRVQNVLFPQFALFHNPQSSMGAHAWDLCHKAEFKAKL